MSKAWSVILAGAFLAACTPEAPDPTEPFEVPVFSHTANAADAANGGNFGSPLSGDEEVPARPTRARGSAVFQLNAEGDALTYRLMVANIENVFQAHIHNAATGVNGPIVVWLYPSTAPVAGPLGQGRIDGVIAEGTITAANFVNTLAGQPMSVLLGLLSSGTAYVNVHTNDGVAPTNTGPGDFPGGEVRGQVEHRGH
ncbi:MAG TPA: CHRD domain-containing protein [Gemmatimonadales bacterium]|nr:CHRD domain-containing protein [Gemmatimonadales bacterium]